MGSRIIQVNLHKCFLAKNCLVQDIWTRSKPTIAILQEPYIGNSVGPMGVPGSFGCYYGGDYPRAAIVTHKCDLLLCPPYSGRDVTTCQMSLEGGEEVYIVSVYCDGLKKEVPCEVVKLLQENRGANFLICMDTNAHSSMWGCDETDPRGEMMEDFIVSNNLVVVNKGKSATYIKGGARTIIDVTLASTKVWSKIDNWRVSESLHFSDHKRLSFNLRTESTPVEKRWVTKSADWKRFQELMTEKSHGYKGNKYWTPDTVEWELKRVYQDLNHSLSKVCPKSRMGKTHTNKWWNKDLSKMRTEGRRLEKQAMRNKDDVEIWTTYRRARNDLLREIRKAKRAAWRDFTNEATSPDTMNKLTKIIFRSNRGKLGHLKRSDGTFTSNKEEVLDTLMDSFFPGSKPVGGSDCPKRIFISDTQKSEVFTREKIRKSFESFKRKKAPGPDKVGPEVLHNLDGGTLDRLADIYGACLALGYVPNKWRLSKAVLIPKEGKKDYTEPRAFRPISLTSFLFKGMERIVGWHLEELGTMERLSKHQHAFRKNHSTETILSNVVDLIENSILRKGYTLGVFFDIEGAFDNALPAKVEEGLRRKEVPEDIIDWYGFYLSTRRVKITLGKAVRERALTRGTPQGGILSPLMWNIVFDSLLETLEKIPGIKPRGYADDGMFLISGICPNTLIDLAQPAIDCAIEWGRDNGLKFSATKTQALLFTKRYKTKVTKNLVMSGKVLPLSDKISYLGVTLTKRLGWEEHITAKIQRAKAKLIRLKTTTGVMWGPSPRMLIWAYNSIIIPAVTYGALVWGHKEFPEDTKLRLARLNRLVSRGAAPTRSGTPTAGLEVIMGLKPLDLVIRETGMAAYWRWKPELKWPGRGEAKSHVGHLLSWIKLSSEQGLKDALINRRVASYNWDPPCEVADGEIRINGYVRCNIRTVRDEAFTYLDYQIKVEGEEDRLKGILRLKGKESNCLYKGFEEVLGILHEEIRRPGRVVVTSRHRPAALTEPIVSDLRTLNLLKIIKRIRETSGYKITFRTAKGRRVSKENRTPMEGENVLTLPALEDYTVVKEKIKAWGTGEWNGRWISSSRCAQTKLWMPTTKPDLTSYFRGLTRQELGKAIQFITGHNSLLRHEAKLNKEIAQPDCRLCGQGVEDAAHLWSNCTTVRDQGWVPPSNRCDTPQNRTPGDTITVWTPEQLSRFLRIPLIASLLVPDGGQQNLGGPMSV